MVRFENVGLRYGMGPEVLRDLTFRIEPNSFQFLTGPSGAGKTSLLRLLFLSLRPTRGLITQFGHDVATLSKDAVATLRRRVGIVFQEIPTDSFFIGAKPVDNFVRIWVDHIARTLPTPEAKARFIKVSDEAIAPFVKDRGYDWEFHIDETPFDLWSIQGLRPPSANSDAEKKWVLENRPTPY